MYLAVRSYKNLLPGDIVMINSCKASQSDLFPAKYIVKSNSEHIFAPLHTNGEFIPSYESFNELYPIQLNSLDQLDQYIITEENGDFFDEYIDLDKCKIHYTIKYGRNVDMVLPIESIVTFKAELGRFESFEKLINLPNDPLPPIQVEEFGDIYRVVDGHHRLEYSYQKGYTHIPVSIVKK